MEIQMADDGSDQPSPGDAGSPANDALPQVGGVAVVGIVSATAAELLVALADGTRATVPVSNPLYPVILGEVPQRIAAGQVDAERDRRSALVLFTGETYRCDAAALPDIISAGAAARAAVAAGAAAGDLRWLSTALDFAWTAAGGARVPMDAQQMQQFADAAATWVARHALAARTLEAMDPIPLDYASDGYWPAA
jgi:hypothetical protein